MRKIDLLKNTKQVYRTCVGNYQFSKLEEKKSHECPETYVDFFFHVKKKSNVKKYSKHVR